MFTLTKEFEQTVVSLFEKLFDNKISQVIQAIKTEKHTPKSNFITKNEACQILKISLSCLDKKLAAGKMKRYYVGNSVRLKLSDVEGAIK